MAALRVHTRPRLYSQPAPDDGSPPVRPTGHTRAGHPSHLVLQHAAQSVPHSNSHHIASARRNNRPTNLPHRPCCRATHAPSPHLPPTPAHNPHSPAHPPPLHSPLSPDQPGTHCCAAPPPPPSPAPDGGLSFRGDDPVPLAVAVVLIVVPVVLAAICLSCCCICTAQRRREAEHRRTRAGAPSQPLYTAHPRRTCPAALPGTPSLHLSPRILTPHVTAFPLPLPPPA